MYKKIVHKKRLYMFFIFVFLYAFQYFYSNRFTSYRIIQFAILNASIVSFVFAFHGFELNTMKSKNATLISTTVGSFLGTLIGMFFIILIFGAKRDVYRNEFIVTTIVSCVAITFFSQIYYKKVFKKIPPSYFIVIGDNKHYRELLKEVEEISQGKVVVKKWISSEKEALEILDNIKDESILIADLKLYRKLSLDIVILPKKEVQKYYITEVVEDWLNRIPLNILEEYKDYYEVAFNETGLIQEKRITDIVFGLVMGILTAPFIILFGILVVLNSGFPIIFKQERIGIFEQTFMFFKIRSLKEDKNLDKSDNPNGTINKRLTLVGKILRKTRVDEFPQFYNILNGTMSVVGPRPEMGVYYNKWKDEIPFYKYRSLVRPGLTGWAQINYGHTTTLEEYKRKTEFDLYYVKNRSLFFDFQIIMKTFETFLGLKGGK